MSQLGVSPRVIQLRVRLHVVQLVDRLQVISLLRGDLNIRVARDQTIYKIGRNPGLVMILEDQSSRLRTDKTRRTATTKKRLTPPCPTGYVKDFKLTSIPRV